MAEQPVAIDWSEAEVEDGRLIVPLRGEAPKGWKDSFERTVQLLGKTQWDHVKVKKGSIRIGPLEPGHEDDLRFYLESVVEQANADHQPDDPEDGADRGEDDEDEPTGPDAEMTRRFRSFADAGDEGRARDEQ